MPLFFFSWQVCYTLIYLFWNSILLVIKGLIKSFFLIKDQLDENKGHRSYFCTYWLAVERYLNFTGPVSFQFKEPRLCSSKSNISLIKWFILLLCILVFMLTFHYTFRIFASINTTLINFNSIEFIKIILLNLSIQDMRNHFKVNFAIFR